MYTGNNGFYASADVDNLQYIEAFFDRIAKQPMPRNETEDIGLHTTIMYSLSALQITPAAAERLNQPVAQSFIAAAVSGFDFWPGHDNEGYFVAKLKSKELETRHRVWKHAGAVATFEDYQPHITLVTGPKAFLWDKQVDMLNYALKAYGALPITLKNETIADLKD